MKIIYKNGHAIVEMAEPREPDWYAVWWECLLCGKHALKLDQFEVHCFCCECCDWDDHTD